MPQNFNPSKGNKKTRSYVHFITTPTADSPGTALLLHFDDKRYIIGNVHEGLQRAGLQIGSRFFKAKDFFVTGKTEWQSNGGLLGMILSLADASKASATSKAENSKNRLERQRAREEEAQQNSRKWRRKAHQQPMVAQQQPKVVEEDPTITIHGGPNLTHTVATARSFIFRHGTPIKVNENHEHERNTGQERNWQPSWEDEMIQVWAMVIAPANPDTALRPSSPRKRSLGEYMDDQASKPADMVDDQWSVQPRVPADQENRNQQIREFVVSEMFSSSWRYDNLVETPLQEVKMPAGLFVRDPQTKKVAKYEGPVPDGTTPVPNIKVLVRQPWPGALVDHLPPTKPSPVAMSYIIRNHKQRGKFKPEVAKALKVPPGPLWSTLAAGAEVQSSDGKTVTPDMVLEAGKDGGGLAVVDLPSKEYVRNLVSRPEWSTEKVMTGIGGIVWILGPGVSDDETLRDFMKSKPDLKHIISSSDHCPNYLVQTSAATAAIRHNQIDPIRFPIPVHSNVAPLPLNPPVDEAVDEVARATQRLLPAKRGLRIDLEPSFGVAENDVVPYLNTALVVQEIPQNVISLARAAQRDISSHSLQTVGQGLPSQDAEIICLGTGSALPSPYRNVAGTLLRVPGHGSYLLDCGEDTLGQLKRVFTESELSEIFYELKLIWISHLHADHHLGITSVIRAWYEEVHGKDPSKRRRLPLTEQLLDPAKFLEEGKRLFIVAHGHMMRWLEEYSSVEDFGYNQLLPVCSFPAHWSQPDNCNLEWNGLDIGFNTSRDPKVRSAIRKATSLSNLVTVPVSHCYGAQAVSLTFPNGFKFSYSGDCRPSREFAIVGKGSTVLLHEATFDDDLMGDAVAKKHSTTSEAIGVGVAMGAKRVLLTHFSQRYQRIPSMGSMNSLNVRLEDAEEVMDPMLGMEPPVNAEDEPTLETSRSSDLSPKSSHQDKPQDTTKGVSGISWSKFTAADPAFASLNSITNLMRAPVNDMKVGVAFDYMRVKVGDIMHLDRLAPAMRELYKAAEKEEADAKVKKAAREAFSDNQEEVTPVKIDGSVAGEGRREATGAGGKFTVQSQRKEKKERNRSYFEKRKRKSDGADRETGGVTSLEEGEDHSNTASLDTAAADSALRGEEAIEHANDAAAL